MEYELTIYVDGAVRGNPGPAGIAGIIFKDKPVSSGIEKVEIEHSFDKAQDKFSEYIGEATNNEAEYKAVILALEKARSLGAQSVLIYSDSELLVKQITGAYKVKSPHLKTLLEKAKILWSHFAKAEIKHISREENSDADRLANQALQEQGFRGLHSRVPLPTRKKAIIGFLSDFGLADGFVGICKGVIKDINQDAEIIDISHDIPDYDARKGAFILASAVPFVKAQVFIAVVDPGVGASRRGIAIQTEKGSLLVGPDNGILLPAASRLGGIKRVFELTNKKFMLQPVSQTFHGRDVFAPIAAHIALGTDIGEMGPEISPQTLAKPPWKEAELAGDVLRTQVIDIDKFGTVHLNASAGDLSKLHIGLNSQIKLTWDKRQRILPLLETFGQVKRGEALLLVDSSSFLSIAVNQDSAAQKLRLKLGDTVIIQLKSNTVKKLKIRS